MRLKIFIFFLFIITLFSCKQNNKGVVKKNSLHDTVSSKRTDSIDKAKIINDSIWKVAEENTKKVDLSDLQEVNNKFTFRGAYINPKLIFLFIPWLNDDKPPVLSVDIAAANVGTNQFYTDQAPYKNSSGFVILEEKYHETNSIQYHSYEWLGMLSNKVHVLRCIESSSDGSGEFISLLFVRFEIKKYNFNGKQYNQLIMQNVSSYGLGDRVENTVKLDKKANQIKLTYKEYNDSTNKKERRVIQL